MLEGKTELSTINIKNIKLEMPTKESHKEHYAILDFFGIDKDKVIVNLAHEINGEIDNHTLAYLVLVSELRNRCNTHIYKKLPNIFINFKTAIFSEIKIFNKILSLDLEDVLTSKEFKDFVWDTFYSVNKEDIGTYFYITPKGFINNIPINTIIRNKDDVERYISTKNYLKYLGENVLRPKNIDTSIIIVFNKIFESVDLGVNESKLRRHITAMLNKSSFIDTSSNKFLKVLSECNVNKDEVLNNTKLGIDYGIPYIMEGKNKVWI